LIVVYHRVGDPHEEPETKLVPARVDDDSPLHARVAMIFVLSGRSWAAALAEGRSFSEARIAAALPDDPRVGRLLRVNPSEG
jgi:hypothetical protein